MGSYSISGQPHPGTPSHDISYCNVLKNAPWLTTRSEPRHAATDCTQDAASESGAAATPFTSAAEAAWACFTVLTGRFFSWLHTDSEPSEAPLTHCTQEHLCS